MVGEATARALAVGIAFAAALGGAASCVPIGAFACAQDTECGPAGVCEEAGYCSSIDEDCPSGRRYSRYAPAGIADRCVDEIDGETTGGTTTGGVPGLSSAADDDDDAATESSTTSGADPVRDTGEPSSTGAGTGLASACLPEGRAEAEPVLLYDFCEGAGTSVESITEVKLALELENGTIGDGFQWVEDGLLLDGDPTDAHTALRSFEPTFARLESCREGGEVTLEVWATPLDDSQGGPTGIVTLGSPTNGGGVDLGLFMNPDWSVRGYVATLRTTDDELRMEWPGTPFLAPNHLVLVHEAGTTTLYLDGEVLLGSPHAGDLSEWNPNFDLVLGNLSYYDVRNWRGTFHLVAIYCEALDPAQVLTNYQAGHRPP
jgi:hypothetical protein